MEFLDFKSIAKAVSFKDLLDMLEIPYTEIKGELRGQGFIVTLKTNRYTNPTGNDYGNVINFVQRHLDMGARDAASWLKKNLLAKEPKQPELPVYTLEYCQELADIGIPEEIATKLEIGKIKNKGYNCGKIGFRVRDINNVPVGYIIYDPKKSEYYPVKQYKHDHIYNLNNVGPKEKTAILYEDPINAAKHSKVAPFCIGMTRGNLTEAQVNLLKRFERILIIHHDEKQAQYLVSKLSKFLFVMSTTGKDEDFQKFALMLTMGRN